MSDFWGIAQNRVINSKKRTYPGVIHTRPQIIHNIHRSVDKLVDNLRRSRGKPKIGGRGRRTGRAPKVFWVLAFGVQNAQKKTRAPLWVLQKWKSGKYGGACPKKQFGRQLGVFLS